MDSQTELDLIYDLMQEATERIYKLRMNDPDNEEIEENVRLRDYLRGRSSQVYKEIKDNELEENEIYYDAYEAAAEEADEGVRYMAEKAHRRWAENLEVIESVIPEKDKDFAEFLAMHADHSTEEEEDRDFAEFLAMHADHSTERNPEDDDEFLERFWYEEEERDDAGEVIY